MRAPLEITASTAPLGDLSAATDWSFSGSLVSCSIAARECPNCALSRQVWSRVAGDQFGFNSLAAFAQRQAPSQEPRSTIAMNPLNRGPVISAGILIGAGLGGFLDGVLLHQILQWHNMLSSVRPPVDLVSMKYNMVWD